MNTYCCKLTRLLFSVFVYIQYAISTTHKSQTKLNILMIVIDDMRCLSDDNIYLPNLNKLAKISNTFQLAYAQQALCGPSRNSLLTGRRPDTLHLYDFYSYWRNTVGNYTTLPQLFKENGYHTVSVGKIFHPGISSGYTDDYPYSWSTKPYHPSTQIYKDRPVCRDDITGKLLSSLICPVVVNNQPEHTLPDLQILKEAVNVLKNTVKPFFLAVGFHKPHIPLKYPVEYLERYPISQITPPQWPLKPDGMPLVAWQPWTDVRHRDDIRRLNISFPMGIMPQDYTLRIKQSYLAASAYVDDLIGQLLEYVDFNNTVVVLTSDHGWSLGENGLWAKYSNFDMALKVPLLIYSPNIPAKLIRNPVELIDIFPTLVDITGIKTDIPQCNRSQIDLCFEGKSLLRFLGPNLDNSIALSQYPRPGVNPGRKTDKPKLKEIKIMGYSMRNNRFRYTEWISFNNTDFKGDWEKVYGIELYDHLDDKYEARNLYGVPKFEDLVKYFSVILRKSFDRN